MEKVLKYPRTPHIEGSNLQDGDYDLSQISFSYLKDKYLVIEEKVDGSNVGISFQNGELLLQNRSHYLEGGYKEKQYDLFKLWVNSFKDDFYNIIGNRYIIYGEWMYAKHNIFYDSLPHYFLEFDVYDKEEKVFLDTKRRQELLKNLTIVSSVPVLKEGYFKSYKDVINLVGESKYISSNVLDNYSKIDSKYKDSITSSRLMEGIYIKVEEDGVVKERFKFVRRAFKQVQEDNNSFFSRPIIPNMLDKEIDDLFVK